MRWRLMLAAAVAVILLYMIFRLRGFHLKPETTQALGCTVAAALRSNFPHAGAALDALNSDPAIRQFLPGQTVADKVSSAVPDKAEMARVAPPVVAAPHDATDRAYAAPAPKGFESKGERACRRVFEDLFERPFPRMSRCKFLRNPYTNGYLELDGFNEELRLAFEYDGIQHHEYPAYGGQTEREFLSQVYRDDLRRRLCDAHNVYLIRVPYTVKPAQMHEYVYDRLPETVLQFLVKPGQT